MAETSRPALCIVGAGALGIALAQYARRLDASVILVDRGFGEPGDGPQAAMRLASLQASAAAAAAMRSAARLGLPAATPKISMKSVQERARQVAAGRTVLDSHERLAGLGIEVVTGPTRFVDASTLAVGDVHIRPRAFILAVGSDPVAPDIPGLEEAGYFTAETILDNDRKLTHLLVIGANAEAVAMAQIFARLGSQVTVVPQGRILANHDPETTALVLRAMAEDGVRVLDGASVMSIQPRSQGIGASIALADSQAESLDLSHILVCHGVEARLGDLSPDMARLRPLRGAMRRFAVGALGQTSNRRIRLAGMAAGIDQWHHALAQGRAVVETLVLGAPRRRLGAQPSLVLTEPALAQIGRMPADVSKLAAGHGLHRANLWENDAVAARGEGGGLIKVLTGPKGRIVGASVVGTGAAELAAVLALAMDRGISLADLADLSLPHPSVMGSLVALGENQSAPLAVSFIARWRGEVRRLLRV